MAVDPVLELQGAIIVRLRADADVAAIVGPRVYDIPPASGAAYPYISIGYTDYRTEDYDCAYGGEITIQVDCVSSTNSYAQVRQMASAVRSALRDWEPELPTNALVTLDHWRTDYNRIDGAINHASIRYTAIVEEP